MGSSWYIEEKKDGMSANRSVQDISTCGHRFCDFFAPVLELQQSLDIIMDLHSTHRRSDNRKSRFFAESFDPGSLEKRPQMSVG
eukprot:149145-Hanusia_phi.AAC.1